jgi:hypothetical protein
MVKQVSGWMVGNPDLGIISGLPVTQNECGRRAARGLTAAQEALKALARDAGTNC